MKMTYFKRGLTKVKKKNFFLTSCVALSSTLLFSKKFYSKEVEKSSNITYSSIDVTKKNFQHITQEVRNKKKI